MKANKFFLSLVLGVSLVTAFTSCDKDDKVNPNSDNLKDYITEYKWFLIDKYQSSFPLLDLNGDGKADLNLYSKSECARDNMYIFKKGGVYELNTYVNACEGETPNSTITFGKWKIDNNNLIIEFDDNGKTHINKAKIDSPRGRDYPKQYKIFVIKTIEKIKDLEYEVTWVFGNKVKK